MLKKVLLVLALALVVLALVVASRPAEFTLARTGHVAAPPAVAFALVSDFHRWPEWSPWSRRDPNQKTTFDGAPQGVGAQFAWSGNDQVGAGRVAIVDAKAGERLDMTLEFVRPMASTHGMAFTFAPKDGGTDVTWSMSSHNDFVAKGFSLIADMDALVGKDFEAGLAELNKAAQAAQARQLEAQQKKATAAAQ